MMRLQILSFLFCLSISAQNKNEIDVGWIKVCEPRDRESYFNCLDSLYQKHPQDSTYLHVLFEKAIYYNDAGIADSVIKLSKIGIKQAELRKGEKSETMKAAFMNLLAAKYQMQGKYGKATDLMLEALAIFEKNENNKYASILNFNIGVYHVSLKDHLSGKKYFQKSYERFKKINDSTHMSAALIALSECHLRLEEFKDSKRTAEESYRLAKKANYIPAQISYFYITGSLYEKENKDEKALENFNEGQALAEKSDIYTNYYLVHFIVDKMKIYNKQKKYNVAIEESERLKDILSDPSVTIILHDYHKTISESYFGVGQTKLAYEHLETAYAMKEKTLDKENKEIVNKLTLEYETEKKEKQIAEQELEIQKKNNQRNIFIGTSVGLGLLALLIFGSFYQNKRINQQRITTLKVEQEAALLKSLMLGEEKERKRLAQELHDGIASNLVAVKLQIENNSDPEKLLNLVRDTHREVRQVAHNLMPIDFEKENIVKVVKTFCEDCSTEKQPIIFQSNIEHVNLNKDHAMILYRVVQEFIQNAIKHSNANQIDVMLMKNEDVLTLSIEDDGVGFNLESEKKSKGLSGIFERFEKINGQINIDSSQRGTSVFLLLKTV